MKVVLFFSLVAALVISHYTHNANAKTFKDADGCKAPICLNIGK